MKMCRLASARLAVVALIVAACAPMPLAPPESATGEPGGFPQAQYRKLLADGKAVFSVDSTRSLVVIDVRRGGSLARFGHDHVVASHDVKGYVAPDEGRADFYVPLDALAVDEPELRTRAGLGPQPDADDIAGTRRNMLEKVLDVRKYPYALISVETAPIHASTMPVKVNLTLHGVTRVVDATMDWVKPGVTQGDPFAEQSAEDFSATGVFAIDQSAFGIAPLSILGGAISVQDRVHIRVDIRARRLR